MAGRNTRRCNFHQRLSRGKFTEPRDNIAIVKDKHCETRAASSLRYMVERNSGVLEDREQRDNDSRVYEIYRVSVKSLCNFKNLLQR